MLEVPNEDVGQVIGKKGSTIQLVQQQTAANIQVPLPPPPPALTLPPAAARPHSAPPCLSPVSRAPWAASLMLAKPRAALALDIAY